MKKPRLKLRARYEPTPEAEEWLLEFLAQDLKEYLKELKYQKAKKSNRKSNYELVRGQEEK